MRWLRSLGPLPFVRLFCLGCFFLCSTYGSAQSPALDGFAVPPHDIGIETLAKRKKAQLATVNQFKVFYGFRFTDQVKDSGITFRYQAVDDAREHWKPTHYDHGSAVAVADVDGDGLYDILFLNQVGGNELWKNLGHGKFTNISSEAGIALPGM